MSDQSGPAVKTRMIDANGLSFEVDCCEPGTGTTPRAALALCLHEFPELNYSWRHQLPVLAALGYDVWAPNLRGYGNTSRPEGVDAYSVDHLMADVAGLIDASGHTDVLLIGHDWGAVIAWLFATREVRPLTQMVIINVPHPACMAAAMTARQLRRSWYMLMFQLPLLPEMFLRRIGAGRLIRSSSTPGAISRRDAAVYDDNSARPGAATAMINYYRALLWGGDAKAQARLGYGRIDTPTLMLWGEDDVALGKETTVGTERYVADLTLRYLPRVSHWAQQDVPDVVNAMISAFVSHEPVPQMRWRPILE